MENDFKHGGKLAEDLLSRLEKEVAGNGFLVLSNDGEKGVLCQGITGEMNAWLGRYVIPERSSKISEIQSNVTSILGPGNQPGIILSVANDTLNSRLAHFKNERYDRFNNDNNELLKSAAHYDALHDAVRVQEGNRDAIVPNLWLEFGLMGTVLLISETLINFDAFRSIGFIKSDLMAIGLTIVAGFLTALAGYNFGLLIRRWHYYSQPGEVRIKRDAISKLGLGTICLIAVTSMVGVLRYVSLGPAIEQALLIGVAPPGIFQSVFMSVIGNFAVFLVCMLITYFLNDPNPEYSGHAKGLKTTKNKLKKIEESVRKEINEKSAWTEARKEENRKFVNELNRKSEYCDEIEKFKELQAVDEQVSGLLREYKSALVKKYPDLKYKIRNPDGHLVNRDEILNGHQFISMPIKLSWSLE